MGNCSSKQPPKNDNNAKQPVSPKNKTQANALCTLGVQGGGTYEGVTYSKKGCFEKAAELAPKYAPAWSKLGVVGGGTVGGLQYSQRDCFMKAIELNPKSRGG